MMCRCLVRTAARRGVSTPHFTPSISLTFVMLIVSCVSVLLRLCCGLFGYSGHGTPPMYGDFEAQRHWLEITINTKMSEWYVQTQQNDLLYWGLDYPPLTAYVSYAFGKIAQLFYPPMVALYESRGHESDCGKVFMRLSVLILDCLVLFPAIKKIVSLRHLVDPPHQESFGSSNNIGSPSSSSSSSSSSMTAVTSFYSHKYSLESQKLLVLLAPALILIDYGHFQYNCVCIGLTLSGLYYILKDKGKSKSDLLGSFFFCMALNFKQMTLYYSPVFFFSLLRKCLSVNSNKMSISLEGFKHLFVIGITVIGSFAILWLPFCFPLVNIEMCLVSLGHILSRIFPFHRGIFEDKVANLWYASSVVFDYRDVLGAEIIIKLALALTLLLISPIAIDLLKRPLTIERGLLALVNSALAFFLASYQVHEKSLLLALIPAAFLSKEEPMMIAWFQILGTFSMFPLLLRDGLTVPYIALIVIYVLVAHMSYKSSIEVPAAVTVTGTISTRRKLPGGQSLLWLHVKKCIVALSILGMILLHIGYLFITPPVRLPDLFPALFALYSSCNLLFLYIYFMMWQCTSNDHSCIVGKNNMGFPDMNNGKKMN